MTKQKSSSSEPNLHYPKLTAPQVKSLCVVLDSSLSFHPHINNITRSAYFHQRIYVKLIVPASPSAPTPLLSLFIALSPPVSISATLSSLVYHGSLCEAWILDQIIKNSAAHIITKIPSFHHITPSSRNSTVSRLNYVLNTKFSSTHSGSSITSPLLICPISFTLPPPSAPFDPPPHNN